MSALISFLNLAADSLNAGKFKIRSFTFNTSVKLDLAALKALQIVPVTGKKNKNYDSTFHTHSMMICCRRFGCHVVFSIKQVSHVDWIETVGTVDSSATFRSE